MHPSDQQSSEPRQRWMAVLARSSTPEIEALLARCPPLPDYVRLRGPEIGLVMARGRAGGTGQAFNLGEIAVTRCTVRSASGVAGHAYVRGRDMRLAELAAALDAALQDPEHLSAFDAGVIAPLASAQALRRARAARKAASTQVRFFTMATMRS